MQVLTGLSTSSLQMLRRPLRASQRIRSTRLPQRCANTPHPGMRPRLLSARAKTTLTLRRAHSAAATRSATPGIATGSIHRQHLWRVRGWKKVQTNCVRSGSSSGSAVSESSQRPSACFGSVMVRYKRVRRLLYRRVARVPWCSGDLIGLPWSLGWLEGGGNASCLSE